MSESPAPKKAASKSSNSRNRSRNRNRNRSRGKGGKGGNNQNKGQNRGGQKRSGGKNSGGGTRQERQAKQAAARKNRAPRKVPFWRKALQFCTFGLFRADPYEMPPRKRDLAAAEQEAAKQAAEKKKPATKKQSAKKKTARTPEIIEPTTPRLYVGNLAYKVSNEDLEKLFSEAGTVSSAEVVANRRTNRSKGYAFVVMSSVDEAKAAAKKFHDHLLLERKMVVSGAKSSGQENNQKDS